MKAKNTKMRMIILGVAAAGLLGWAAYAKFTQTKQTNSTPTPEEQTTPQPASDDQPTKEEIGKTTTNSDTPTSSQAPGTPSNQTKSINVHISNYGQSGAGTPLVVRANITGTTTGTCRLTLKGPGGATVSKTSAILNDPAARCTPFSIAASEMSNGSWEISLKVVDGSNVSASATASVIIEQ